MMEEQRVVFNVDQDHEESAPTLHDLLEQKDELFDGMRAFDADKCLQLVDKFLILAKDNATDEILGHAMEICERMSFQSSDFILSVYNKFSAKREPSALSIFFSLDPPFPPKFPSFQHRFE